MLWTIPRSKAIQDISRVFLFGFEGKVSIGRYTNVRVYISGQSKDVLRKAESQIEEVSVNFPGILEETRLSAYHAFEVMRDVYKAGELNDLWEGPFPEVTYENVWEHMALENVEYKPSDFPGISLFFFPSWEIEHTFNVYVNHGKAQDSGISI